MKFSLHVVSGRPVWWLVLVLLLAGLRAQAQAPAWQTAAAAAGTVTVLGTDTDGASVYLAGNFVGAATFGSTTLTTTSQAAFVAKWSTATSSFLWAVQSTSTGTGTGSANAVVVGSSYVFVTGNFTTTTFRLGTATSATNAQTGTSDIFFARLLDNGSSGTVGLVRRAGGTGNDYATAIAYAGTLFVGGSNSVSAAFGTYTLPTAGGYIAGFTVGGSIPSAPVPMGANVLSLAASPAPASLYAAGSFTSANNLFGNASYPLTNAGGTDAFVARLTTAYAPQLSWAQAAGGPGNDYAMAVQATGSSVYVAGNSASASATYGSTTLTNAGGGVAFVAKLTDTPAAGTFSWALQNGGSTSTYNSANALSATGNILYMAGSFGGTASFGATTLTSAGSSDVVLAKLTDNGSTATVNWAQQAGGAGNDYATGVTRAVTQVVAVGQVAPPAAFGSLSIGTGAGSQPGFLAAVADPAPLLTLVAPNAGAVGSTTTLYGLNLTGATSITFAGTTGNVVTSGFTVNAAGTIISGVVVPSGAQSGGIVVTTPQGSSNGAINFTVVPAANAQASWQTLSTTASNSSIWWAQPDASGDIVVAGNFTGTLTLGSTTLTSAGGMDVFVAKLNASTNTYVWAVRAGSSVYDDVAGLAVTPSGIYLAAEFDGPTATLGGLTLTSTGGRDSFVAKLTDAGSSASFTWAQLVEDGIGAYVEALTASGSSVYISGEYVGTNLTLGTGTLAGNTSGDDGFIAKFTDNGSTATFNWAKGLGDPSGGTITPYGLTVQGSKVYLAGTLYGTVTLGSYTLTGSATFTDIAIVRFADAGTSATITAALGTGSTGSEFVGSMASQGNALYISGQTTGGTWPGTSGPGSGNYAAFVLKVTDTGPSLTYTWVQLMGGPNFAFTSQLAVNGTGVYVVGTFTSPGPFGSLTLLGAGATDGFVAKLTDAGSSSSVAWVQAAGGPGADTFYALALRPGKVYIGGILTPLAACGPLVVAAPPGTPVAALASLNDASVLAAVPATALAGGLALYPNPAHDAVTVQLPVGGAAGLTLFDIMGREVRRYPATTAAEATLDLHGLPAGLYVLRGAGSTGQKLVVE